jgi:hypothetical protein
MGTYVWLVWVKSNTRLSNIHHARMRIWTESQCLGAEDEMPLTSLYAGITCASFYTQVAACTTRVCESQKLIPTRSYQVAIKIIEIAVYGLVHVISASSHIVASGSSVRFRKNRGGTASLSHPTMSRIGSELMGRQ